MSKYVDMRNLYDENGNIYYPQTHVEAVEGIDANDIDSNFNDINTNIDSLTSTLAEAQKTIAEQDKIIKNQEQKITVLDTALGDMIGDTGWVDYTVGNSTKNGGLSSGFKCAIREVRGGVTYGANFRVRTIRINMGNVPHNTQIAQLPTGFVDGVIRFVPAVSSGHTPPTISIDTDGIMRAFFPSDDRDGKQWVYGQYTWIVN